MGALLYCDTLYACAMRATGPDEVRCLGESLTKRQIPHVTLFPTRLRPLDRKFPPFRFAQGGVVEVTSPTRPQAAHWLVPD